MGHKSLQRVYDKPDEEELLEEYLKAIDLLTINDENRMKAKVATLEEDKDRMVQELTRTVEDMQAQLQPKDNQLQELRNEIKVLREKKHQEIHVLREQMNKMNVAMDNLVNGFKTYKKEECIESSMEDAILQKRSWRRSNRCSNGREPILILTILRTLIR